jgi:hypothetical protein
MSTILFGDRSYPSRAPIKTASSAVCPSVRTEQPENDRTYFREICRHAPILVKNEQWQAVYMKAHGFWAPKWRGGESPGYLGYHGYIGYYSYYGYLD